MSFTYKDYTASDDVTKAKQNADSHSTYTESSDVTSARDAMNTHNANKVNDWTGGTYGQSLKDTVNKITNREKFNYDVNGDSLYQQYKDKYMNQGRLAMQDTIGESAALTGGYGNSYATTAGSQAYQSYLTELNDKVPELYQLALDKYNQEGEDLQNQYSMYNSLYNTEYGEYRDKVSDWNTEANRLSEAYYNAANLDWSKFSSDRDYYSNAYESARDYDYSLYADAYSRAFQAYQQQVSEDQWQKEYELSLKASGSGGGSGGGSSGSSGRSYSSSKSSSSGSGSSSSSSSSKSSSSSSPNSSWTTSMVNNYLGSIRNKEGAAAALTAYTTLKKNGTITSSNGSGAAAAAKGIIGQTSIKKKT